MAIRNVRGSSRAARRIASKNLLLAPPKSRKGLLLGSSFAGGALMILGATLLVPNAAQAACAPSGGNTITCSGSDTTQQNETTPGENFIIDAGEPNIPYTATTGDTGNGTFVITNNGGYGGSFTLYNDDGSSITDTAGNALYYINSASGTGKTVTLNIYGDLDGGSSANTTGTKQNGDGLHVGQGSGTPLISPNDIGSLTINVGSSDLRTTEITGADDGIYIGEQVSGTATVTNYGTVTGRGLHTTTTNAGEGIHISEGDHGVGAGYQISGGAIVDNYGEVYGNPNFYGTAGDATAPGDAINISALGNVTVTNHSNRRTEYDPGVISGTDGVVVYGGGSEAGDITVTNYGSIVGNEGDGVSIQNGGVGTITNHSYQSIIGSGGTAGVDAENLDQVIFNNQQGLTAGLTVGMAGAYINNISGTGHDGEDAVHVINTKSGIIAGAGEGLGIANVGSSSEAMDVVVDNNASWSWWRGVNGGGLIVGLAGSGVDATSIAGNLVINNQLTWDSTVDLNDVDTAVYDSSNESGLLGTFAGGASGDGIVNSGIFGTTGIYASGIGGDAIVNNEAGLVVGSAGDGAEILGVTGNVYINNQNAFRWGDGGLILGTSDGVAIGGDDEDAIGGGVYVDNQRGGIFGLDGSGVTISDVTGLNASGDDAVDIDNTHSGIIGGSVNGITVSDLIGTGSESNDLYIDNSGYWRWGKQAGGLIVGENGDGVSVSTTEGDVTVDNSFTRNWGSIDLTGFDSRVDANESGSLLSSLQGATSTPNGDSFLPSTAQTTGIWGLDGSGVDMTGVAGAVTVLNEKGQIVGMDDAGVRLSEVGSGLDGSSSSDGYNAVYINNSNGHRSWGDGGLLFGDDYGIVLDHIENGNVVVDNTHGSIYGDEMAFALGGDGGSAGQGLTEGDVYILNGSGMMEGAHGSNDAFGAGNPGADSLGAITINGVHNVNGVGGHVQIWNSDMFSSEHGGTIVGTDTASAISIGSYLLGNAILANDNSSVDSAAIFNGLSVVSESGTHGGLIVGSGSEHEPVILLNTSTGNNSNGYANGYISNYGVIASTNLYGFQDPDALVSGGSAGDLAPVYTASSNVWSGLQQSTVVADPTDLATLNNGGVASDHMVAGSEGGVTIDNQSAGVMFGLLDLTGANSEGGGVVGNSVWNWGAWYTSGVNTVQGEGADSIHNEGLIQTAFNSESWEETTFNVDNFYNDIPDPSSVGILSMIDGDVVDTTTINGNFYGSEGDGTSYLAIDANFDKWDVDNGTEGADHLVVNGSVYGSTGVIVNKVNTDMSGAPIGAAILFASDNDTADNCTAPNWCSTTDPYYIASSSSDYLSVNGVGYVGDGLVMWGVQQTESGVPDNEYSLVSTAAPDADNQPLVLTSLLDASIDTGGTVEEHSYGNEFPDPNLTNGGADLSTTPTTSSGKSSVLWGRAVGSWSNRDATVTGSSIDLDTSADTSTYALQAGLELRPNADGEGTRLGLYGGYLSTNTSFDDYGGSSKASGGTVGAYAALIKGGWYIDGEVKADFLGVNYSSPTVSLDTNATTVAVFANTGYRMQNGSSFIEPLASFTYANTTIGDATNGTDSITYNNGQSIRAGVGARLGTTMGTAGGTQTTLDLTGRVWDEFGGPNSVVLSDGNPLDDVTLSDSISGVYGEVVGRATIYNADRSASGFVSVGGKFGNDLTSVEAKVGARKAF